MILLHALLNYTRNKPYKMFPSSFYSIVVSTSDFESGSPSSILGRSIVLVLCLKQIYKPGDTIHLF